MPETTILAQTAVLRNHKKIVIALSPTRWINRIALAIIYCWFGVFKIIHQSPAQELVANLHSVTFVHYIPINIFQVMLGYIECIIGILWLVPRLTKTAFTIFSLHIITTFLPLFFLPDQTWSNTLILTMSGQYIMKNLVLAASALTVFYDYKKTKNAINTAA